MGMKGEKQTDMEGVLVAAGAVGLRIDGSIPRLEEENSPKCDETAESWEFPYQFSRRNPAFAENQGINRGKASGLFWDGGFRRPAEIIRLRGIVWRDETEFAVVIQHISNQ